MADSPEGLRIVRHSAAHLMAAAVLALFPEAKFAIGPAIEDGFYYDMELPRPLVPEDLPVIEAKMREMAGKRLSYDRREVGIEEALAWARQHGQPYKVEILEALRDHGTSRAEGQDADVAELAGEAEAGARTVTLYQTGSFVDLCRGPHVPDTSWLAAFRLTHLAGAYWRGDERRPMLQRIYGTAFLTQQALDDHLARLEEARRRDHRRLGQELDLFSIHDEVGSGLVLWHPKGGIVRKLIEDFWRDEHLKNGYDLVYSPHVGRAKLWQTSGHLDFYQELMYPRMEREGQEYYVKPMNCPFHIMIYQSRVRSYRDLPLRFAELGTVYRYERAGVLHGLLRVRGFTQDDAHIFCTPEQMDEEITRAVKFSLFFLRTFGFKDYVVYIATRPEKFVGDLATWDAATEALKRGSGAGRPELRGGPGRRRVLRSQDRHQGEGRSRAPLAVHHGPVRLQPARAVRDQLRGRGQPAAPALHGPPGAAGLHGAVPGGPDRALRGRLPGLAGPGAGPRAAGGGSPSRLRHERARSPEGGGSAGRGGRPEREDRVQDPRGGGPEDPVHPGGGGQGDGSGHGVGPPAGRPGSWRDAPGGLRPVPGLLRTRRRPPEPAAADRGGR